MKSAKKKLKPKTMATLLQHSLKIESVMLVYALGKLYFPNAKFSLRVKAESQLITVLVREVTK